MNTPWSQGIAGDGPLLPYGGSKGFDSKVRIRCSSDIQYPIAPPPPRPDRWLHLFRSVLGKPTRIPGYEVTYGAYVSRSCRCLLFF